MNNYFFPLFRTFFKSLVCCLMLFLSNASWAEEVKIQHRGLTLNANLEMAEGKDFKDGMVLVLHGLFGHNKIEIIETSQRALLDNGRSSLAITLSMGINDRHGFIDCGIDHRHLQTNAMDEIQTWINWLKSRDVTDVVLMGHSRAANQIMVYAVEQKDPVVKHLLFLAPSTSRSSRTVFVRRYGDHFDQALQQAQEMITVGKGEQIMKKTDFVFCPQANVTANSFASYYSPEADARIRNFVSYLPRLSVPTLIINGTEDERQPHIEKNVKPYIDGKLIHLSNIEGAGHFFLDFNIDEAMEAAVEFLEQRQ